MAQLGRSIDCSPQSRPAHSFREQEDQPFLLNHVQEQPNGASFGEQENTALSESRKHCDWLPLTLRLPYLVSLVGISFLLGALVLSLTAASLENQGISDNDDSTTTFFGWRFLPTFVATIYSLLVSTLVNDVRRTEIFARLSNPKGASAANTISLPSRAWWNDPFDAWSKKKNNGSRSWALFSASVSNLIALLVISPLSAIFLSPVSTQFTTPTPFSGARMVQESATSPAPSELLAFRTTIGASLNQSTSAWLSTEHAIVPFWPSTSVGRPLGSTFSGFSVQQWKSKTTVYQAELDCIPMSLTQTGNVTWTVSEPGYPDYPYSNLTFEASSDDGCSIVFSAVPGNNKVLSNSGGWWVPSPYVNLSVAMKTENATLDACADRSMLLVGIASNMVTGNCCADEIRSFDAKILLCSSRYFSALVDATVSINQTSTTVAFDVDKYNLDRKTLPETLYNSSLVEHAFFTSSWAEKFGRNDGPLYNNGENPWYGGPLSAITAGPKYNMDPQSLYNSTSLLSDVTSLFQQFFGETLLDSWKQDMEQDLAASNAAVILTRTRIVASVGVGLSLGTLILLSGLMILTVLHKTRLVRRPLNLYQDPGKIESGAALLLGHSMLREKLCNTDLLLQDSVLKLDGYVLTVVSGRLNVIALEEQKFSGGSILLDRRLQDRGRRPAVLRLPVGISLMIFLSLLLTGLAVLYHLSREAGLYQTSLVYQLHVKVAQHSATLAPYSIVPTLFAIGAKIWFALAAETIQKYQPFIAMVKRPTTLSESVSIEYLNTPIALVTPKALRCSHWLLALVGAGAFATEAFTVCMSALWYRKSRDIGRVLGMTTDYALRTSPSVVTQLVDEDYYLMGLNETRQLFTSGLYDVSLQNWLYGATIEITQSAATPAWSKDTWSFVPRNLSNSADMDTLLSSGAQPRNITLRTTALKASLVCYTQHYPSDPSLWVKKIDFRNATLYNDFGEALWNVTNRPSGLAYGYVLKNTTDATLNMEHIDCCANETSGRAGSAAVGYWSNANGPELTSTWIVGHPIKGIYTPHDYGRRPGLFVWQEPPEMAAISCEPRIEEAEASVTVEINTGIVSDYNITSTLRNASGAWAYPYTQENLTRERAVYGHGFNQDPIQKYMRVNASWGYIFWDTVINSGQEGAWFRFHDQGLNVDLMSYAMLNIANNSPEALLDPSTLTHAANKAFGTFFKHFVCWNITEILGGYAYKVQGNSQSTYEGFNATLSTPTEELRMSPTAAILSMSILVFLIIVTLIMYTTNRNEYRAIPRDVDTLASTLGWVYASDKLLAWAENAPLTKPWYQTLFTRPSPFATHHRAKMGPFTDSRGNERWGIELVDTRLLDTISNHQKRVEKSDAEPVGEWMEMRTTANTVVGEAGALGTHERLLDASYVGSETAGSADEHAEEVEHESTLESHDNYRHVPRTRTSLDNSVVDGPEVRGRNRGSQSENMDRDH